MDDGTGLHFLSGFQTLAILSCFKKLLKRAKCCANDVKMAIFLEKLQKMPSGVEICPQTPMASAG